MLLEESRSRPEVFRAVTVVDGSEKESATEWEEGVGDEGGDYADLVNTGDVGLVEANAVEVESEFVEDEGEQLGRERDGGSDGGGSAKWLGISPASLTGEGVLTLTPCWRVPLSLVLAGGKDAIPLAREFTKSTSLGGAFRFVRLQLLPPVFFRRPLVAPASLYFWNSPATMKKRPPANDSGFSVLR